MKTNFIPTLFIRKHTTDIQFYETALGAMELRRWSNSDGSIHVAELSIGGAMFRVHEEDAGKGSLSPESSPGITAIIGLSVQDVDTVMSDALTAGALEISAAKDYEYGYRQAEFEDPFGHRWLIEQTI